MNPSHIRIANDAIVAAWKREQEVRDEPRSGNSYQPEINLPMGSGHPNAIAPDQSAIPSG
jgi:hypothetical protein